MTCEVCGNDPVADARARDRQHEIKRQYRRALYLACGGDKEKVKRMMSRAEDEMCQVPPNTVLRPSSNELGEAIDAAVEMIERLEAAEQDALEQARLNGMGAERELALMAKLEAAEKERDAAELMSLALRAKVAEMEQQVPICRAEDLRNAEILLPALGLMPEDKLYALPGAQGLASSQDEWKTLAKDLLREIERQTCAHEETHRGGFLWEICDACGAKWADDEGGKPEFKWPEVVEKARAMLAAAPEAKP